MANPLLPVADHAHAEHVTFSHESSSLQKPAPAVMTTISAPLSPGAAFFDNGKCQDHRQRYPEVEAVLQLFFRGCSFLLNIIVLVIVRILDTNMDVVIDVQNFYGVLAFCISLDIIEFASLCNPRLPLLIHLFPYLFPAVPSNSASTPKASFPRLPSLYLAICECAAIITCYWSAVLFLNPAVHDDANRSHCPKATCVTIEEHKMIIAYVFQVVVGLIHAGFFFMAAMHWFKRKAPGWLDAWDNWEAPKPQW